MFYLPRALLSISWISSGSAGMPPVSDIMSCSSSLASSSADLEHSAGWDAFIGVIKRDKRPEKDALLIFIFTLCAAD